MAGIFFYQRNDCTDECIMNHYPNAPLRFAPCYVMKGFQPENAGATKSVKQLDPLDGYESVLKGTVHF